MINDTDKHMLYKYEKLFHDLKTTFPGYVNVSTSIHMYENDESEAEFLLSIENIDFGRHFDSMEKLVDYAYFLIHKKHSGVYDGEDNIEEVHPSPPWNIINAN